MPDLTKSSVRPRFDEWYAWCQKETNKKWGGTERKGRFFFGRSPKVLFLRCFFLFCVHQKTVCFPEPWDKNRPQHLELHRLKKIASTTTGELCVFAPPWPVSTWPESAHGQRCEDGPRCPWLVDGFFVLKGGNCWVNLRWWLSVSCKMAAGLL